MITVTRYFSIRELDQLATLIGAKWKYLASAGFEGHPQAVWPIYACGGSQQIGLWSEYTSDNFGDFEEEFNELHVVEPADDLAKAVRDGKVFVQHHGLEVKDILIGRTEVTMTERGADLFSLTCDSAVSFAFSDGFVTVTKATDITCLLRVGFAKEREDICIPDYTVEWLGEPELGVECRQTTRLIPISTLLAEA